TAIALANTITNIPVIFSCVTDPVNAGLVDSVNSGKNNVTGLSDAVPTAGDIRFFKELAGIKTLGYIYTSNEDNSISSLAEVRAACAAEGIELVEQSITKSDEVKQAAEAIVNLVDGIYLTTDNTVFSALSALVGVFNKAHKPIYSADVTGAQSGGIAFAKGFNYYKSGLATAKIVERCMKGEKPADIPVVFMTDPSETDFLLDLDTIADCGLTVSDDVRKTANLIYKDGKLSSVSF
ncbi:MAG: ABC transporter substrate-binding protein, partial [Treponema sp.]|nr:ABC transporter substrate-binding protein [Treponema sp.]